MLAGVFFYVIGIERAFPEDCKKASEACAWLLRMGSYFLGEHIFFLAWRYGTDGMDVSEMCLMAFYTYIYFRVSSAERIGKSVLQVNTVFFHFREIGIYKSRRSRR